MMYDAIKNFNKQFEYEPVIENADRLEHKHKLIVCGMGGSHLGADILQGVKPRLHISIHPDYGLPAGESSEYRESLVVASSYSRHYDYQVNKHLTRGVFVE